jgi:hypothetical protein
MTSKAALAQVEGFPLKLSTPSFTPPAAIAIAQSSGDDSYDPFSDYSEFEESMEEEEDTNFFRNGRLFTMGFIGGYRTWTGTFANYYQANPAFGVFISYFFDLRFAMQFGYLSSEHMLYLKAPGHTAVRGTVGINDLQCTLKYYFNTQNVTRGLADFNPYVIGGFSQIYRTTLVSGNSNFGKDSAFAVDIGGGFELPMMHNKMYVGVQGTYQLVNFANESSKVEDPDGNSTGVMLYGDSLQWLGILGVNF